ncbi:PAS domain S-box protein [Dactylosporangium roseum]|uniref:histidine kinase n=1 Tax=Dactylosporangium roseum TaxID=47989 RepID=A0ABY5Z6F7_9ACTN|nr:ATP-binding protein [Dactylosporangium roseum]UWZ37601.1 PAS domain S-box protein [Dactylosporangium roseum]
MNRVLLVEDNADDAEMLVFELRRAGFAPAWERVDSRAGFLAALTSIDGPPDVILADYALPQFNALEALRLVREGEYDVPVIVVSGAMSEEECVDALRHGAVDYLLKDRLSRLGSAVGHALSQRRLAHDRRRAEETFRAAFDHAPVGMAVTDLAGRVLQVNQELSRMTGLQVEGLLLDTICEEDRPHVADRMKRLVAGETDKVSKELRLCRPDGSRLWGQYSAALIDGATSVVHHVADVTDRRRTEDVLQRQAEKLARTNSDLQELDRLKSEFVATVSHELRTPLTSIRGYTEILADTDSTTLGATERRIVGIIDRNGRRLLDLIEDLLTFSRIESGTLTLTVGPVRIRQLVDAAGEAIRPAVETAGLAVILDVDEHIPVVQGDGDQLERVVLNLLDNAVKFSDPGGTITVTGRERDGEIVVWVRDTGVGIPEHEQSMLFTRFFRTADAQRRAIKGSGLGLAISKAIVEAHGGWMALESTEGVGTTVGFGIPIV